MGQQGGVHVDVVRRLHERRFSEDAYHPGWGPTRGWGKRAVRPTARVALKY